MSEKRLSDDEIRAMMKELNETKKKTKRKLTDGIKKILSYLGYALSVIGALGYLITIITLVRGVSGVNFELMGKDGLFFIVGLVFGLWIRTGFYIQGVTYSKEEHKDILKQYHELRVKDKPEKRLQSFEFKLAVEIVLNTVLQIAMFAVTSVGFVYLATFEGIDNPIYIMSALSNLIMFTGFGLLALAGTYEKYNDLKIPIIKERVRVLREDKMIAEIIDKEIKEKTVEPISVISAIDNLIQTAEETPQQITNN